MNLFIIGLNHRTTPLGLREQLSIRQDLIPGLLPRLREEAGLDEIVLLSTCNRLEIYGAASSGRNSPERVFEAMTPLVDPSGRAAAAFAEVKSNLYVHAGEACVRHLFRVAASLDSLVVGETEIAGQVKKAYQLAHACGTTGKILNRLFQKSFSVAKEVRTRSGIGRCSTSVSSIALDVAAQIFGDDLGRRSILVIGAGQIGETTLRHAAKRGARSVVVVNRSLERARELAAEFQGEARPFSELGSALAGADIVISSTSAACPILRKPDVADAMAARRDKPLLLVDLAVPRDIDPGVLDLEGVYLYNIDELSEIARHNLELRQQEAAACEAMVSDHAGAWSAQFLSRDQSSEPARSSASATAIQMFLGPGILRA
jgi:glutamyl-tRNA reductase